MFMRTPKSTLSGADSFEFEICSSMARLLKALFLAALSVSALLSLSANAQVVGEQGEFTIRFYQPTDTLNYTYTTPFEFVSAPGKYGLKLLSIDPYQQQEYLAISDYRTVFQTHIPTINAPKNTNAVNHPQTKSAFGQFSLGPFPQDQEWGAVQAFTLAFLLAQEPTKYTSGDELNENLIPASVKTRAERLPII